MTVDEKEELLQALPWELSVWGFVCRGWKNIYQTPPGRAGWKSRVGIFPLECLWLVSEPFCSAFPVARGSCTGSPGTWAVLLFACCYWRRWAKSALFQPRALTQCVCGKSHRRECESQLIKLLLTQQAFPSASRQQHCAPSYRNPPAAPCSAKGAAMQGWNGLHALEKCAQCCAFTFELVRRA